MKNIILEFDMREITLDEMKEHILYYITNTNKAMEFNENNDLKNARYIYNKIKKNLKLENNYYEKGTVQKTIKKNNNYKYYFEAIHEACVKQINPNSNKTMHSNLYDIKYYIRYWTRYCDLKECVQE